MFSVMHNGDVLGTTNLESGDPAELTVSGIFHNVGGPIGLAAWIKGNGGEEDKGAIYVTLNNDFSLLSSDGDTISFKEGTLIAVPDEDEAFLEISGLKQEDYKKYFPEHVAAASENS